MSQQRFVRWSVGAAVALGATVGVADASAVSSAVAARDLGRR